MTTGDKVQFIKPGAALTGYIGIIREIRNISPHYMVEFLDLPNEKPYPCGASELRVV